MGFSERKSAWINEYGDPMTIIRPSGNVSTAARFVKGRQLLAPFDINFVRFMVFPSESDIQVGDLVRNETLGYQLFVTAIEERTLLGGKAGIYTELYTANYPAAEVQRYTPGSVDEYGNQTPATWTTVGTVPMSVEHVNGNVPYKDGLLLADTLYRLTLQTATALQLIPNPDRIIIDGRNFQVSDINVTVAPGLQIVQVKTDNRT
ncbi:phage head completion protein [Alicyclobacillus dauci]|uniref:Head-tail adaptor protein n=1 Tax=Alicyclobacillus dauci TaxID=1475485 RepID=A0ABY6YZB8_9BACL|nr:head-tail adaptor protein [Alicyclobacillus dauci]WAH35045.1 head-tail adaptor protein [Alicyclobacillus dauci]